ncbi:penicillin-binding transpeptidase domain-containing protein [Myceligenerans salitolerans]|uniref:penicillin-binding transpeptidase domain-containing protein n=1 Tax=Myceligenerans salitolerans TaxID=1230528 RepID=UPI0027DC180C|nr:penicillin-binding transpeptidase domain-containing protein [Myceligenerans salitolerans]
MQPEPGPNTPPPAEQIPPVAGPPAAEAPRRRRTGAVLGIVAAVAVAVAGAALAWFLLREPPIPAHEPVAEDFGTALGTGELADFPVTTETSVVPEKQYDAVFADLLESTEFEVSLAETTPVVEADDGTASFTATYAWAWPFTEDEAWEYTTDVEFTYPGADGREPGVWQAAWSPAVLAPELESGERLAVERVDPRRADIVGAGGKTIVTERDVLTVGVDKSRVDASRWSATARTLAELLDFGDEATDDLVARTEAAGERAFVQAIVIRVSDPDYDRQALEETPGVLLIPGTRALAPTADFARPILGTTGEATAEIIEESDGRVEAGDVVGLSGLQAAYDEQLAGTPGIRVTAAKEDGDDEPRELWAKEAKDGEPVELTLDVAMQQHAEQVLADAGEDSPSAIVAVDATTGGVLAAASGEGSQGYNTAMLGQYPPGSTFKIASALGMLRNGLTPDSTVSCPEQIVVGKEFDNVDGYPADALGDVPFRTAFAHSCNTAMVGQHELVSQQDLHDAAASLGLGLEASRLGAAGYLGEVPADDISEADHAASFIGQARVLASPLAMATVAASVAGGSTVSPVLVVTDETEDGEAPSGTLEEDEAATLRELMGGVVEEGSAQEALAGVTGVVGAKTGSAEGNDGRTNVWMVAIKGDIGVAVFVEDGDFGSTTAGPIMRDFLTGG